MISLSHFFRTQISLNKVILINAKKSLNCYNRKPLQYLAVSANPQEEELVVVDDMENLLEKNVSNGM